MIKRNIIYTLIFTLLFSIIGTIFVDSFNIAKADTVKNQIFEENLTKNEQEIKDILVDELNTKESQVKVDLETTAHKTNLDFQADSSNGTSIQGNISMKGNQIYYTFKDGNKEKLYQVFYNENHPNFVKFIDKDTKQVYNVDLKTGQLSIWGLLFKLGGTALKALVKISAKNATKSTLKVGKKVYKGVSGKKVKNALKYYKGSTFRLKNSSKSITLSKNKLTHILQHHHPKYWNGIEKTKYSFFDPDLSIKTIQNYIKQTINSNQKVISKNLKYKADISVTKKINKVTYRIVLNSNGTNKKASVTTFYPESSKKKR